MNVKARHEGEQIALKRERGKRLGLKGGKVSSQWEEESGN